MLYCIVLYCIVLYCIVLYCIVLYCIVLCCIVLYFIVLCCIVLTYQLVRHLQGNMEVFPLATERTCQQRDGHFRVEPIRSFQNQYAKPHIQIHFQGIEALL